eukprot:c7705_g1_i1.p1 GENE.c7705_g1_i1~~c7705_g1_i1.p1  ORF type:complete len:532 (+),score=156.80 c7705_g1_i1:47-1597(+)
MENLVHVEQLPDDNIMEMDSQGVEYPVLPGDELTRQLTEWLRIVKATTTTATNKQTGEVPDVSPQPQTASTEALEAWQRAHIHLTEAAKEAHGLMCVMEMVRAQALVLHTSSSSVPLTSLTNHTHHHSHVTTPAGLANAGGGVGSVALMRKSLALQSRLQMLAQCSRTLQADSRTMTQLLGNEHNFFTQLAAISRQFHIHPTPVNDLPPILHASYALDAPDVESRVVVTQSPIDGSVVMSLPAHLVHTRVRVQLCEANLVSTTNRQSGEHSIPSSDAPTEASRPQTDGSDIVTAVGTQPCTDLLHMAQRSLVHQRAFDSMVKESVHLSHGVVEVHDSSICVHCGTGLVLTITKALEVPSSQQQPQGIDVMELLIEQLLVTCHFRVQLSSAFSPMPPLPPINSMLEYVMLVQLHAFVVRFVTSSLQECAAHVTFSSIPSLHGLGMWFHITAIKKHLYVSLLIEKGELRVPSQPSNPFSNEHHTIPHTRFQEYIQRTFEIVPDGNIEENGNAMETEMI